MQPKSVLKRRKSDFDGYFDCDDEVPPLELSEDSSQPSYSELTGDNNVSVLRTLFSLNCDILD